MMDWYDGGPGWGGWILMTLMMLAFWALLIFGGVAVYRSWLRADPNRRAGHGDAERLLDERFARGEIDTEDYTRHRELLRAGH